MKRRTQTFRITKGGDSYISPAALADEIGVMEIQIENDKT